MQSAICHNEDQLSNTKDMFCGFCVVWVGGAMVSTSTTTAQAQTTTSTGTTKSSPQFRDCRPVFNNEKHDEILHFRDELDG
jgi:hypothetical protein